MEINEIESFWADLLTEHRKVLAVYLAAIGTSEAPTLGRLLMYSSEVVRVASLVLPSPPD